MQEPLHNYHQRIRFIPCGPTRFFFKLSELFLCRNWGWCRGRCSNFDGRINLTDRSANRFSACKYNYNQTTTAEALKRDRRGK